MLFVEAAFLVQGAVYQECRAIELAAQDIPFALRRR